MQAWLFIPAATYLVGIVAFGAIAGSFINVVAYRLPRGKNIVVPASACPQCGTRLSWRENFPILGWFWLRGRCRFCRSPISFEYPLVEMIVASLFGMLFALWMMYPSVLTPMGIDVDYWKPDWAHAGMARTWPMFSAVLVLIGSLVCATIVDAKTFTIPLAIPWVATAVGLLVHPLHAAFYIRWNTGLLFPPRMPIHEWTIPVPDARFLGVALGGALGIALSIVLLRLRVLPLSFADYEEWEKSLEQEQTSGASEQTGSHTESDVPASVLLRRVLFLVAPALALALLGWSIGMQVGAPRPLLLIGLALGLLIGLALRRLAEKPSAGDEQSEEPIWTHYPHCRREILKEMLFLAPCVLLALLGGWLTGPGGPLHQQTAGAPLWLSALGGSLLGYLVGGGSIWFTRILGSLAFGKEAMGLGDVHLLAAAGAVLGWIDPLLAFLAAPFLGIAWVLLSLVFGSVFKRAGTALPYGPHLAAATLAVIYAKPLFETGLSSLLNRPVNIP